MNCKPGDLALIVRSSSGNVGKIVVCIKMVGMYRWLQPDGNSFISPCWLIDRNLRGWDGTTDAFVPDVCLRPLRDPGDDAKDETLRWQDVPVPEIEEAPAA